MAKIKGYPEALEAKLRDRYLYGDDANPKFTETVEESLHVNSPYVLPVWNMYRFLSVSSP